MVTTVTEELYKTLEPVPHLRSLDEFDLRIHCADGNTLPYLGYIEASIGIPFLDGELDVPVLIIPSTSYGLSVPVVIGTNVIRLCKEQCSDSADIPQEWNTAFLSVHSGYVGSVKSTNNTSIDVKPGETVTISGFTRKVRNADAAVTETSENASSRIGVCPRVVTLAKSGCSQRVPVRLFNISAKTIHIPPRTTLCDLHEVNVLRHPDQAKPQPPVIHTRMQSQIVDNEPKTGLPGGIDLSDSELTESQKNKVAQLFVKWEDVFSKGTTDIGHTKLVEHRIKLDDEKPFKEPHRRIPPGLISEVREHLNEMLTSGAIRPSESPYSSNVVLVRKKDGTIRFCVDFRKLNNRTVKDAYAIPRVEDTLHLLAGAKYFSKLDLRSGYWQVEVNEEDKDKTAFQVGTMGFYEFNRMPFGLCNAPATFQRLMEKCMGDMNLRDCLIYLDDIIIFSTDFDQQLERLEAVFQRLHDNNLKLKASKCDFFKREVTYLGHIVSEDGIKTDPEKTKAVATWPEPKTIKEVRRFLGFTGYYRRFVKDFSKIARPLNDLLVGHSTSGKKPKDGKKKSTPTPFKWGDAQQDAFDTLKEALTAPPVLAYADYRLPFKLHTDASGTGLGAVLYQCQEGVDRVVAYASRSLKTSERKYPAHKLEFLALKWAICEKFHDYLYGSKFDAITDNNPLTYVLTTAKLDATGQRWVADLTNYNFTLTYRSGKQNTDADALSRQHTEQEVEHDTFPEILKAISFTTSASVEDLPIIDSVSMQGSSSEPTDDVIPDTLLRGTALTSYDWKIAHQADQDIAFIISCINRSHRPDAQHVMDSGVDSRYLKNWSSLVVQDGVLLRKTTIDGQDCLKMVIPQSLRELVFEAYHDDLGHQGRDRTLSLMRQRVYWPGMDKYIQEHVRNCGRCIRRKKAPTRAARLVNISSSVPMEFVCVDYLSLEVSKGGYENILVITDHFSRYAQAIPTRNQTAQTTARVLFDNFFVHYGFPTVLHSDKGANFESKIIKNLCRITGMKKSRTTPYHPMGNGMVERFNQTLLNMLGTLTDIQKADWKAHVPTLTHAYNAAIHESTGYSPYYLMFGRHPRLAVDAFLGLPSSEIPSPKSQADYADKLKSRLTAAYDLAKEQSKKAGSRYKRYYDQRVRYSALQPGDRVLVRNVGIRGKHKLADTWEAEAYIVKRQPMQDIPVYEVYKEQRGSRSKCRTLHRNMLLPFMALGADDEGSAESTATDNRVDSPALRAYPSSSDSTTSASEEDVASMDEDPQEDRYVIPARRQPNTDGPVRQRSRRLTVPQSPDLQRRRPSTRQRRPPQRYRAGDTVMGQLHTFSVPASDVVFL